MKIKPVYIFNIIAVIIVIIFVWVYLLFQNIQEYIIKTNYKNNISYVKDISTNLTNLIQEKIKSDDYATYLLNKPSLRDSLEKEMSLFVTNRYKYIYLVDRKNEQFRFLLDGSLEDRAMFLENYEPVELDKWNSVYKYKKDIYFTHKHIQSLWLTYLKPIIVNNEVKAILVVDFSIQPHVEIEKSLNKLNYVFKLLMYFFIFIFIIIVWFSFIDLKREKKLFELNKTLENKVKEEIEKNRQKDEQILYQSRLAQMGEMMSMIAHQWRQPLAAISATIISIKLKSELNKLDKNILISKMDSILKYTNYLSNTIDDFRDFFKPTKQKKLVTFDEIVSLVLEIIGLSLRDKNINVKIDIRYKKKLLLFENEFKQVVLNLLKNSEDVLENVENKEIEIRAYKKDNNVIFEIEDNGGGIDEKIIDKIFEPYFSTKDSKNGTGLGLYMSKIIIEKHLKGILNVYNSKRGAVFQIILKEDDK